MQNILYVYMANKLISLSLSLIQRTDQGSMHSSVTSMPTQPPATIPFEKAFLPSDREAKAFRSLAVYC